MFEQTSLDSLIFELYYSRQSTPILLSFCSPLVFISFFRAANIMSNRKTRLDPPASGETGTVNGMAMAMARHDPHPGAQPSLACGVTVAPESQERSDDNHAMMDPEALSFKDQTRGPPEPSPQKEPPQIAKEPHEQPLDDSPNNNDAELPTQLPIIDVVAVQASQLSPTPTDRPPPVDNMQSTNNSGGESERLKRLCMIIVGAVVVTALIVAGAVGITFGLRSSSSDSPSTPSSPLVGSPMMPPTAAPVLPSPPTSTQPLTKQPAPSPTSDPARRPTPAPVPPPSSPSSAPRLPFAIRSATNESLCLECGAFKGEESEALFSECRNKSSQMMYYSSVTAISCLSIPDYCLDYSFPFEIYHFWPCHGRLNQQIDYDESTMTLATKGGEFKCLYVNFTHLNETPSVSCRLFGHPVPDNVKFKLISYDLGMP